MGLTSRGQLERISIQPAGSGDTTLLYTSLPSRFPRVFQFLKVQIESYFRLQCRTFNIPLMLSGTDFELRVWNELLTLQFGQCLELTVLAHRVGLPSNPAAVAKAIGSNPIAILVPSHRVLGWETATGMEGLEWLHRLRALEDITPGESTCLMASSLPSTMAEMARSVALSPPARFRSTAPRGIVARLDP